MNQGIANFYDESSGLWEQMWGEHMHHGYYPKGGAAKSNQAAQIDMIEEVLSWAGRFRRKEGAAGCQLLSLPTNVCAAEPALNTILALLCPFLCFKTVKQRKGQRRAGNCSVPG